jgi:hypothetical protein
MHCPASVPVGKVRKFLRQGKALVLPVPSDPLVSESALDFRPRVSLDPRYGKLGKIMLLRYHPNVGSTNPVCQAAMR